MENKQLNRLLNTACEIITSLEHHADGDLMKNINAMFEEIKYADKIDDEMKINVYTIADNGQHLQAEEAIKHEENEFTIQKKMKEENLLYKLFTVPSSDDERAFEECDDYSEALKINEAEDCYGEEYTFSTKEERDAFIEGYLSGIGYLGEGVYFTTNQNKDE